jgi:serine/threonine-protein kinase
MIGKTVSHYQILEQLGEGGMGVVYKALDTKLDRHVAIKFLPPQFQSDPDAKKRFVHEAKAASALDHSSIAIIHEIDETTDGQMFIVMAYYRGQTLKERIREGALPEDEAVKIVSQIASGLSQAHGREILHRDIKPANILLSDEGDAKLADFGLAKLAGRTQMTKTGTTVGTISYMAPEQASGGEVDRRSDLFSLGVVLYELLSGVTPFKADHEAAVIYGIIHNEPAPIADIPPQLQRIVSRSLEKNPDNRYQSADEMLRDIEELQGGPRPTFFPPLRCRRRCIIGIPIVAFVVLLAAVFAWKSLRPTVTVAENPDELRIAVAPFWGQNQEALEEGKVMQALVERKVTEQFTDDNNVQVFGKNHIEETPQSKEDARVLGEANEADIVIWGEVLILRGEVEIQPYATVTGDLRTAEDRKTGAMQANLAQGDQLSLRKAKADDIGQLVLLLAGAYYQRRDPERSLTLLQQINPATCESARQQGLVYMDRGEWESAEEVFEQAMELDPNDPYPYYHLGWVRQKQIRGDEAIAMYKEAIDVDPEFHRAYTAIGRYYINQGNYDEAIAWIEECIHRSPDYSLAYVSRGVIEGFQGRYDEAIAWYEKAIATDPTEPNAYTAIGAAHRRQGHRDEGLKWYKKSIEVAPDFAVPYANIGNIYAEQREYDEAMEWYRKAIEAFPGYFYQHATLATLLFTLGRYQEAAASYEKAYQLEPRQVVNGLDYFLCLRLMGEEGEAAAALAALAQVDADSSMTTAIIQFYAGNLTKQDIVDSTDKLRGIERSFGENADLQRGYYYLGMASLLGIPSGAPPDTSSAIAYLEEILAVTPDYLSSWTIEAELERLRAQR